jgi:DNA phosphorothioation-dependent restriction protein DptF
MANITLVKSLGVLAKSSPFSVTTVSSRARDELDEMKAWLFVQQDIEIDLRQLLKSLKGKEVVFLCGSSGDGKSEILTRCFSEFQQQYEFHLDATHSFAPHQSAIQALDEKFDDHKLGSKPLVLGINIGMLANYSNEGSIRHQEIKNSIDRFLSAQIDKSTRPIADGSVFYLDFEQYPRFNFEQNSNSYSAFARTLLKRLTDSNINNPFFMAAQKDVELRRGDQRVLTNYKILSLESVQEVIITQLFKARLIKDQFITTRALLDLIHHLLLGRGYLFDNLFVGDDSELVSRLMEFDPIKIHTNELDQLVLTYELSLPDEPLNKFMDAMAKEGIFLERSNIKQGSAASLIRFFYLMKNEKFGNNYHHAFKFIFQEELLESYANVWRLHNYFDNSSDKKREIKKFYSADLIQGIQRYANRNAPILLNVKDELFLNSFGEIKLTAPIDLKPDYDSIHNRSNIDSAHFMAYLKVGDKTIKPIVINLNLFELLQRLKDGYRPNKYDKNAIVLLDEIIEQVTDMAKSSMTLKFYDGDVRYTVKQDEGMIVVNGSA